MDFVDYYFFFCFLGRGRGRKAARIVSSEEEASMDASEVQEEPLEPVVVEDASQPVIPEVIPKTPNPIELEEKETKHTSKWICYSCFNDISALIMKSQV